VKEAERAETKKKLKDKMRLKQAVRTKILDTYTKA
jgi:hypothetical protein